MWKYWPFKKDYLLIAGAVVLLLISYQLAIKNTLDAWRLNRQLSGRLQQGNDLSYQPGYLERKNKNLDNILALYQSDTAVFRSNTISTIAALAEKNKVRLSEVPVQEIIYHTTGSIIQKLNFEGDFFALNIFLNQLESLRDVGIPKAVNFKTERKNVDPESKKLVLEVYMEIRK